MADRVLVVVAARDAAAPLRVALERAGYEVEVLADVERAVERAIEWQPDGIVLYLPTAEAFEVLRRIRRHHRTWSAVVVLITDSSDPADDAFGWQLEPDDYVHAPADPADTVARLTARIRRVRSALASSWAMLPGGTAIERELRDAVAVGREFALLVVDLDEFKAFNDRYGFVRGNRAIALLARILQSVANDVAPGAFAGHIGGDDFVLITTPQSAVAAAEAIIERFDRAVPGLYDEADRAAGFILVRDRRRRIGRHRLITLSIGIATTERRRFRHFGEVARVAYEMKAVAKQQPFSSYAIDRRSDDGGPPA